MFWNRKENRHSGKELQRKKRNRKYSSIKKVEKTDGKNNKQIWNKHCEESKSGIRIVICNTETDSKRETHNNRIKCKRREKEKQTEKEGRGKESWLKMIYLDLDPAV